MYLSTFRTVLKRLEAKLVSWFAYRPAGDETATSRRIVQRRFEARVQSRRAVKSR